MSAGFALAADPDHGYGEAADEVYLDFASALPRISWLIQNRLETVPPYQVRIKALREKAGISQTDVAGRMGVQQAAVSMLESRDDTHVASLSRYVQALGGRLVLKADFDGREEVIQVGTE